MGADENDNIGVRGRKKTAMDLIQKYGSIDTIYEKLPDIDAKPAAIKNLTEGQEAARHSYWLATIVTDAPLDFFPEDNRVQAPGEDAYPLFLRLEFSKLIERFGLRQDAPAPTEREPDNVTTVEQVTGETRAGELLELQWRNSDHVSLLTLPDLSGVAVYCDTGADTAIMAGCFSTAIRGIGTVFSPPCSPAASKKSPTI